MAEIALDYEQASDAELCRLVLRHDPHAVRVITRRNNQRLYRAAWSVLKNRAEAEEAVQDGYLKAFARIGSFAGASSLSTWLTGIVVNEALERRRTAARRERLLREQSVVTLGDYREQLMQDRERFAQVVGGREGEGGHAEHDAPRGRTAWRVRRPVTRWSGPPARASG